MQREESVAIYQPQMAVVKAKGSHYVMTAGTGQPLEFRRNQDFGKFGKAKKPSLLKAGAEKIIWAYGLRSVFTTEHAVEDYQADGGFFFYRVRCDLYHKDQLITSGYGCANTREQACGFASSYDTANSRLKIARKRAMVDAALMVAQLSDMFSQDEDNDDFMKEADTVISGKAGNGPDDPISQKQLKRIYALAGQVGLSTEKAKELVVSMGYESTKKIKQKDYDRVCEAVEAAGRMKDAT